MADQELKTLIAQGLQAAKAGGRVSQRATGEIERDATNPGLQAALRDANAVAQQWAQRIERAIAETGTAEETGNPVLEALYDVSTKIRQKAPDAETRDLGIIAAGQLALHYWIAAFGTLRTYAANCGLTQTEREMQASLDEAKQADLQHTQLAENILSAKVRA